MATDAREEERSVEGGGGGTEGREKKRGGYQNEHDKRACDVQLDWHGSKH